MLVPFRSKIEPSLLDPALKIALADVIRRNQQRAVGREEAHRRLFHAHAAAAHFERVPEILRWVFARLYRRSGGYFPGSELSSVGVAADMRERTLLASFPGAVRPEVLDGTWRPAVSDGSGRARVISAKSKPLWNRRPGDVGRYWMVGIPYAPSKKSIRLPSARVTYAFFQSGRRPL